MKLCLKRGTYNRQKGQDLVTRAKLKLADFSLSVIKMFHFNLAGSNSLLCHLTSHVQPMRDTFKVKILWGFRKLHIVSTAGSQHTTLS